MRGVGEDARPGTAQRVSLTQLLIYGTRKRNSKWKGRRRSRRQPEVRNFPPLCSSTPGLVPTCDEAPETATSTEHIRDSWCSERARKKKKRGRQKWANEVELNHRSSTEFPKRRTESSSCQPLVDMNSSTGSPCSAKYGWNRCVSR